MLRCYLMDPDTDVCQTEQPQISYSVDFTAEQSSAMGSPNLLGREGKAFFFFNLHVYPGTSIGRVLLVTHLHVYLQYPGS